MKRYSAEMQEPLKVVHLCTHDTGGAGKAAYRLHKGLGAAGINSTMLVLKKKSKDPSVKVLVRNCSGKYIASSDIHINDSPLLAKQGQKWRRLLSNYPRRPAGLEMFTDVISDAKLDFVKEIQGADIINLHWVAGMLDYPSVPLALGEKPIVWTLHDMNPFTGGCHYAGDCLNYRTSCGACPQLGSCNTNDLSQQIWRCKFDAYQSLRINIVTPSRWLAKCASESTLFSRFPINAIPNGFPIDVFKPYSKAEIRKILNIPQSAKVVLFGAQSVLNQRKGFKYLLTALNNLSLKSENENIILALFGNLPESVKITSKYPVYNLGPIKEENHLAKVYSIADVFVISSLEDNLPNTVVEAMACGVPVVGFGIGGIPDMVEHKKTGYLARPKDVNGLIEGINWIVSSYDNGTSFSRQCREKVLKEYSLEVQAKAYIELYNRILQDYSLVGDINTKVGELNRQGVRLLSGDEEALNEFAKAIEMNPDFMAAHNNIGKVYWKKGVVRSALKHFLKALKIDPYDRTTVLNCGQLLAEYGRIKDATKLYWSYLQKNPNDNEITQALENLDSSKATETYEGLSSKHKSSLTTVPENVVLEQNQTQDEKGKYLVSAIVSTYNAERFIRGCMEDLENQTVADKLEIIVVNSGSHENEEAVVRQFQQKYNNIVYIKTERRERVYTAWNRAVKAARGTFLTNANTDDRHRQDALETMAKTLQANPDIALVYGDQIRTDTPNDIFANHHATEITEKPEYSRERLLFGCCTGSQPMWRKSLHDEFGYFDDTLTCAGDWDFWLRISSNYKFKHIPEFLGLYYYNQDGIEHSRKIHNLYERYIVGKRYGTPYISVIPLYQNKNNPLVSVIMPAYNAAEHIAEAIESVLIQNYRNFELVVVDDGSTDNTRDIIAGFKDDKIKYFYKENNGPSAARNLAVRKAGGQYIVPLDSDDMMIPKFIASHLQEFEKYPEADLIYCDDWLIDEDDKPIRVIERREYADRNSLIRDLFRSGFPIVPFRTCIRRSVFDKIGFYDEDLLVAEDYDMMRRLVKSGLKIHHLKNALYLRKMTSEGQSRAFTAKKAKCHFEVVKRLTDTFTYDQLFPDVWWNKIPPATRQLHAKCLAAITYLAIGQTYVKSNSSIYAETAFELAGSQLNDCLRMDPANPQVRQLLQKCEFARSRCSAAPQAVY